MDLDAKHATDRHGVAYNDKFAIQGVAGPVFFSFATSASLQSGASGIKPGLAKGSKRIEKKAVTDRYASYVVRLKKI
jgi:hypothetical protein